MFMSSSEVSHCPAILPHIQSNKCAVAQRERLHSQFKTTLESANGTYWYRKHVRQSDDTQHSNSWERMQQLGLTTRLLQKIRKHSNQFDAMYHTNCSRHIQQEINKSTLCIQMARTEILMTPGEVSTVLKYELKYEMKKTVSYFQLCFILDSLY